MCNLKDIVAVNNQPVLFKKDFYLHKKNLSDNRPGFGNKQDRSMKVFKV